MSKKTDQTLNKCDELIERLTELKKALNSPGAVNVQSNRKPVNTLSVGWSQDPNTGALHHSTHGVISPGKQSDGTFKPVHGGRVLGTYGNIADAGKAMGAHARSLQGTDTGMSNRQSPNVPAGPKLGTGNAWAAKSEDDKDLDKSNYGKFKGGSQYNAADNVKRKMSNTSDQVMNQNVKSYTHRATERKVPSGPAGPVKQYTPAQIAAINEARKLKKNAEDQPWTTHASVPNADAELAKVQATNTVAKAEDIMSNQLANMMAGRAMLGNPPKQPTNEEMFGHLVPSEEEIQKAEQSWGNRMNWLEEAVKPIASRFNSPEEEQAYWDSIKVRDSGHGDYGF